MRVFVFVIISVLAIISVILIILNCLNFNISIVGSGIELRSAEESKEYGVFVSEYYSPEGYILYPDNQKLFIKESWVEHSWVYNYWSKPCITDTNVFGLYVTFNEPVELNIANQDYTYKWILGKRNFAGKGSDQRGELLQFSIWSRGYCNDDSLEVFVTKYNREKRKYDTVTSFLLLKRE